MRPPSPTLVRYILRELAPPTLMGFGLFTFLLLMNTLLSLADLIIRDRVPASDVGLLFLYNIPHVIVLTVPMAVLVGGLIAFGRMSSDSEIIALRASGVSLYQLSLPILLLGAASSLVTFWLCVVAMPWGNNATIQHQWRLINTRTVVGAIQPRVFETGFSNFTLWIEDVNDDTQSWERMLLVRSDTNPPEVAMAEEARLRYSTETGESWLELQDGYRYGGGDTAQESNVTSFRGHELALGRTPGMDEVGPVDKSPRMMDLSELRSAVGKRRAEGQRVNTYLVEIHKKFAIPAACLVMALIAVPLGASTRRHTKATGYLVAIGVIAIYYMFIDGGEKFAIEGAISPWLGMWAGNITIGTAALVMLWNRAREKELGIVDRLLGLFDRVTDAWHGWRGEPAGATEEDERAAFYGADAAALHGRRFPRILDRYVLTQFVRVFALTLTALAIIWMVGEYFEISDDVYEAGASNWVMLQYFQFQLPFIFTMTLPIATILSVLIVFSLMSKHNEVVAVLAGGSSLFRLAAPVLIPAVALTALQYANADYITPYTNQRAEEIRNSLRPDNNAYGINPARGNWMRGQGNYIFQFADYDSEQQVFQGLRIYYLDPEHWRLARVDYAGKAHWLDGRWLATDAWRRFYVYSDDGARATSPPLETMAATDLPIDEGPDYFHTEQRQPEQMSARELADHIESLEARGFDASRYYIDLQQKFAFPAIVFVLALVGIPFGFRMGRQGTLSGVAVALALTVMFWITFVAFRAIGSAQILPPVVAAWAPHVLFLALAGYITAGLRT